MDIVGLWGKKMEDTKLVIDKVEFSHGNIKQTIEVSLQF